MREEATFKAFQCEVVRIISPKSDEVTKYAIVKNYVLRNVTLFTFHVIFF